MQTTRRRFLGGLAALLTAPLAVMRGCTPELQPAAVPLSGDGEFIPGSKGWEYWHPESTLARLETELGTIIYKVSPHETPFLAMADGRGGPFHAWVEDELREARG